MCSAASALLHSNTLPRPRSSGQPSRAESGALFSHSRRRRPEPHTTKPPAEWIRRRSRAGIMHYVTAAAAAARTKSRRPPAEKDARDGAEEAGLAGAGKYFDVFISVTFLASTAPPPLAAAAADNNHSPFTIGHTKHHQLAAVRRRPAAAYLRTVELSSAGIPLCKPLALCNLLSHSRSHSAFGSPKMTSAATANVTVSQQQQQQLQQVCLSGTHIQT